MQSRLYVCPRATSTPALDGRLDKSFWADAPWTEEFIDIQGDHMPTPRFRTRAKMLWDDQYLYIGAEMEEPHVWGTLTKRDSVIFHDNDFEIFIDPDGDNHVYGEIELNALNTVFDLLLVRPYRNGGPALHGWDVPGLMSAVHINGTLNDSTDEDEGWSLEVAIPWEGLNDLGDATFPPAVGDHWRINFSRVQWEHEIVDGEYRKVPNRPEDNWVWSPQGAIDMHRPEMWGILQFAETAEDAAIEPDGLAERASLMRVYHAQRLFREANGRWAELAELELNEDAVELIVAGVQWHARSGAYQVDHESRLRKTK